MIAESLELSLMMDFVQKSQELDGAWDCDGENFKIIQKTDGKSIGIDPQKVEEIISRVDSHGEPFLQVNFHSGLKILLTERLVGFKPSGNFGLNMNKMPKVVTTPDLVSVLEAIEECLNSDEDEQVDEVDVLKRVFHAVLEGGEAVGFDLTGEKSWVFQIANINNKHSA